MPVNKSTTYHPPPPFAFFLLLHLYLKVISAMRRPFHTIYVGVRSPPPAPSSPPPPQDPLPAVKVAPKREGVGVWPIVQTPPGMRPSGYTAPSKEAMMAAVARHSGRAPAAMRSMAAGPELVLRPMNTDIELRYCETSQVQELLGLVHPSRKWSRSRMEPPVFRSRWVVLLVTETESNAALYMRPPGRPRKSAHEQEAKQETKQASKAHKRKEERAEEEEEEEQKPAQKRRKQ